MHSRHAKAEETPVLKAQDIAERVTQDPSAEYALNPKRIIPKAAASTAQQ
jgi:hypothetical protein